MEGGIWGGGEFVVGLVVYCLLEGVLGCVGEEGRWEGWEEGYERRDVL